MKIKKSFKKNYNISIILLYNIIVLLEAIVFYPLVPNVLNYAPGIISGDFIKKWSGYSYGEQYVVIVSIAIACGSAFIASSLRFFKKTSSTINENNINVIRKKCMNLPYIIYVAQIFFPVVALSIIHFLLKGPIILIIKTVILIFLFSSFTAIISFIFSKNIFNQILSNVYKGYNFTGIRINLKNKILLQVIPMFMVAICFTSLIGYSKVINEKGNIIFEYFKNELTNRFNKEILLNENSFKEIMNNINLPNVNYSYFIIKPNGEIIHSDGTQLSQMFLDYLYNLSPSYNGRIYDLVSEIQGVSMLIKHPEGDWIIGFKYEVSSKEAVVFFITSIFILLIFNIILVSYFSQSLANDISSVSQSLTNLAEGEKVDLDQKIPVTSNDEIGDLVVAFNKILDLEKENIRKIHEKHEMLIQSERLASLGQMIGGIAHNLKTPIMSIAGGTEALKDLINEYRESVDDLNVTKEDHLEIAGEMLDWVKEIKSHCAYMSDIISAVKEQAVQMNYSSGYSFTLEELVKRIEILMKYELKKYNCRIEMDIQVDLQTEIEGELNNLVQVFNNLILNAIQAYDEQGGKIDLIITAQNESIEFVVKDYGKGIAPEIKDRLFKEMVTTKGAKGTGIGLYMSYLTVKGKFGGNIWFESEQGEGTVFHLTVPVSKNRPNTEVS